MKKPLIWDCFYLSFTQIYLFERPRSVHPNVPVAWFRDKRSEKGTSIFLSPTRLCQARSRIVPANGAMQGTRLAMRVPRMAANVLILLQRRQQLGAVCMHTHTLSSVTSGFEKKKTRTRD